MNTQLRNDLTSGSLIPLISNILIRDQARILPLFTTVQDPTIDGTKYTGYMNLCGIRIERVVNDTLSSVIFIAHMCGSDIGAIFPYVSDGSIFINTYRINVGWQSFGYHRIH